MALVRATSGSGGGSSAIEKTTEKMTANANYTKSVNNGEWYVTSAEAGTSSIACGYIINGVHTQTGTNQYVVVSYSAGVLTIKCTISDRYLQFFKVD